MIKVSFDNVVNDSDKKKAREDALKYFNSCSPEKQAEIRREALRISAEQSSNKRK